MIPATYDNSVFINCPFDPAYRPLFEAVAFAVYDCGFYPRCALEVNDSSQVRIDGITRIIGECRLAIHDVSHTQPHPAYRLPRYNVAFELGIFLGAKVFGDGRHRAKACVVLDAERFRYQRFISDIAGQDIREHHRRPEAVIRQVRDFLSAHYPHAVVLPSGRALVDRFLAFRHDLVERCRRERLDRDALTFRDLTLLITAWIETHPLPHHASTGGGGRAAAGLQAR